MSFLTSYGDYIRFAHRHPHLYQIYRVVNWAARALRIKHRSVLWGEWLDRRRLKQITKAAQRRRTALARIERHQREGYR